MGDGKIVTSNQKVALTVHIGHKSWVHDFYLISNLAQQVILGVDLIRKAQIIVNIPENEIHFNFDPQQKIKLVEASRETNMTLKITTVQRSSNLADKLQREFPQVLTKNLGQTSCIMHEVKLLPGKSLPRPPPVYQTSPALQQIMKDEIHKLLKTGVIERTTAPSTAPCFLVPKKPDSPDTPPRYRLVTDYRALNQLIEGIDFPLATIQSLLTHLHGAKYFSLIDLNSAYHQIPLTASSKKLVAFKTPFATYTWKRVPFGLKTGGGVLSILMEQIFHDLHGKYLVWYLDDLLIFSNSNREHQDHVREVLNRLERANLTVNPEKCKFGTKEIQFLGHVVSNGKVTIGEDRIKELLAIQAPQTPKQVSQFIGAVNFFQGFIPDYAKIAAPLNALRKKNIPFEWSLECQQAYETLRARLTTPPVLQLPDFNRPFHLFVDASTAAIGSCLAQQTDNGFTAVYYSGRKLNEQEKKWSTYELETFSLLYAIRKFGPTYLAHNHFYAYTDAKAVATIRTLQHASPRVQRWQSELMNYNFTLKHLSGRENSIADYLSRAGPTPAEIPFSELAKWAGEMPLKSKKKGITSPASREHGKLVKGKIQRNETESKRATVPLAPKVKRSSLENNPSQVIPTSSPSFLLLDQYPAFFAGLSKHQHADETLGPIITRIQRKETVPNYSVKQGILFYTIPGKQPKPCLPSNLIDLTFSYYHDSALGSHMGQLKTVENIKQHFYYPGIDREIRTRVANCIICARAKHHNRTYGNMSAKITDRPNQLLYCDVAGPLPRTKGQNVYILIAVDAFSRFSFFMPMKKNNSDTIIKALQTNVFSKFGYYKYMCTDNHSVFRSHAFNNFLLSHGMCMKPLHVHYPNPNLAERQIKTLKAALTSYHADDHTQWDRNLEYLQLGFNSVKHTSHGFTPAKLFLGRETPTPIQLVWGLQPIDEYPLTDQQAVWEQACHNLQRAMERRKKYYDQIHTPHTFKEGDQVLIRQYVLSSKINNVNAKLTYRYSEPYIVDKVLSPVTYRLVNKIDNNDVKTQHVSQLKPFPQPT
ncbi:hypothetical protein GE061_000511 [Apolygus lucorum]|nr:hypothetical protein GE061_000511 [Apolygus lucorum]